MRSRLNKVDANKTVSSSYRSEIDLQDTGLEVVEKNHVAVFS